MTASLLDIIDSFENSARIPALRAIIHSSMAKAIGSIRQFLRDEERKSHDEESLHPSIDIFNEQEEAARAEEAIFQAMGFQTKEPPLVRAGRFYAVYSYALDELQTIATSKWDQPLTPEQMLEFMINNAAKLDVTFAQELAKILNTDIETIKRLHEVQARQEQEELKELTPTILQTFNGFEKGYRETIEELNPVDQHQLGIKVFEALNKAKEAAISRILRTKRLGDLGAIPLLEDAAKQVQDWIEAFERSHRSVIQEAIDAGFNLRTLDDVTV